MRLALATPRVRPSSLISARLISLFAVVYALALAVWESFLFRTNYLHTIMKILTQTYRVWEPDMIAQLVLITVCSLLFSIIFLWVMLASGRVVRVCAFLLFASGTFYEYGYRHALQRFSNAEDLIMVVRFGDMSLFTDSVRLYFDTRALVPVLVLALLLLCVRPPERLKPRYFVMTLMLIIAINVQTMTIYYVSAEPYPSLAFSNAFRTTLSASWQMVSEPDLRRDTLQYQATELPSNNVVLVIDESIRDDHLSINGYARATTPYLEELQQQGMLYNWGEAASGATNSWEANKLLLTGLQVLPDTSGQITRMPTLYQYAKAMGYRTFYFDAGTSQFWNGISNDLTYIDEWVNVEGLGAGPLYDSDTRAAQRMQEIITGSTGNFIVVNKRGVHAYYNRAFPESAAVWTPVMPNAEYDPAMQQHIVNSYDNGILYNVDGFFRTLVSTPDVLTKTTIVYTSDHGQTLAEEGATWSHGNTMRSEARVPLFVISHRSLDVDTTYRASHANLFATVLDLMNVPASEYHSAYAPSLFRAKGHHSQPRTYAYGAIDGKGAGGIAEFDIVEIDIQE